MELAVIWHPLSVKPTTPKVSPLANEHTFKYSVSFNNEEFNKFVSINALVDVEGEHDEPDVVA